MVRCWDNNSTLTSVKKSKMMQVESAKMNGDDYASKRYLYKNQK